MESKAADITDNCDTAAALARVSTPRMRFRQAKEIDAEIEKDVSADN